MNNEMNKGQELQYDPGIVVEALKTKLADSMTEAATFSAILQNQLAREQELVAKIVELTAKIENCNGHDEDAANVIIDIEEKKAERESKLTDGPDDISEA